MFQNRIWPVAAWCGTKEVSHRVKTTECSLSKMAGIRSTHVSCYFGIVFFNVDMAFSLHNMVGNGIPYKPPVWLYGEMPNRRKERGHRFMKTVFSC